MRIEDASTVGILPQKKRNLQQDTLNGPLNLSIYPLKNILLKKENPSNLLKLKGWVNLSFFLQLHMIQEKHISPDQRGTGDNNRPHLSRLQWFSKAMPVFGRAPPRKWRNVPWKRDPFKSSNHFITYLYANRNPPSAFLMPLSSNDVGLPQLMGLVHILAAVELFFRCLFHFMLFHYISMVDVDEYSIKYSVTWSCYVEQLEASFPCQDTASASSPTAAQAQLGSTWLR